MILGFILINFMLIKFFPVDRKLYIVLLTNYTGQTIKMREEVLVL